MLFLLQDPLPWPLMSSQKGLNHYFFTLKRAVDKNEESYG
ncbi:hypothetical protein Godav_018147 [Gossypium davidsonii]|uniref:Uncharacterized protein n=2 Tax=Gossypium TaxID=3633 RepID=A0A7J8QWC8_GOSDV|nr:hypothetical protein [Gossypium davidsonii]MBA0640501.1 hypothetical protein [Gossypium klotzschianum]